MSDPGVAGKTIIITGAASGIGRALALNFLRDGARVIGADIAEEGLEDIERQGVLTVRTDVCRDEDVRRMVEFAVQHTGRVDVLFNNAGQGGGKRIEDWPAGEFERYIGSHLFGALYGIRAAMPVMRQQGKGRIINTLSRAAEQQGEGWAAYATAKAGLFALTRVAASEGRAAGILVNGMIPGPTLSGMNRGPNLQDPNEVYPGALWLATLPDDGPSGRVFWNRKEFLLFEPTARANA